MCSINIFYFVLFPVSFKLFMSLSSEEDQGKRRKEKQRKRKEDEDEEASDKSNDCENKFTLKTFKKFKFRDSIYF